MQILSTIKSIFRLKISYQINRHFKTATYIFQQHIPYSYIDNIFMQFFTANFSSRHAHFSTLIKCMHYPLLLIENYSQLIIYKILHNPTKSDMYTAYTAIFPRKMSAHV